MAKRYFVEWKKVVGILTELKAEADQVHAVIIGPGINVNQTADDFPDDLKDVATSLRMELNEKVDRAALIQQIMSTFEKRYDDYMKQGFAPIKQLWESFAMTIGQHIVARTVNGQYTGRRLASMKKVFYCLKRRTVSKKSTPQTLRSSQLEWNTRHIFDILRVGSICKELYLLGRKIR